MAREIQRAIFIGLGGTGIRSIFKTKALYKEMFGEVPSAVSFLGIDTDPKEFCAIEEEYGSSFVEHPEAVLLRFCNEDESCFGNRANFSWIPKRNIPYLPKLKEIPGYAPLRSNGRFIFELNRAQIKYAIYAAINKVNAATSDGSHNWDVCTWCPVQVHVVFSLCGGTGSGMFLNLGYLLRDAFGDYLDLNAHAVLPMAFAECDAYVRANAYGAALDMDFLMSKVDADHPYETTTRDGVKRYITKPYDRFFFVGDEMCSNLNQLQAKIAQALLNFSGPMSVDVIQELTVLKREMDTGCYDIVDKKAFAIEHGLCEIMVDTKYLSKKASLQAARRLVSSIFGCSSRAEMCDEALSWIHKHNLCEYDNDQLVNSLYKLSDLPQSMIISRNSQDAQIESDSWISQGEQKADREIAEKFEIRVLEVKKAISEKIPEVIMSRHGLDGAESFVCCLKDAFDIYAGEMADEVKGLNIQEMTYHRDRYEAFAGWSLFWKERSRERVQIAQKELLKCKVDISRHEKAIRFYSEIKEYLNAILDKIEMSKALFKDVNERLDELRITHDLKRSIYPFQMDLSKTVSINDKDSENTVAKFAASLDLFDIMEISTLNTDELTEKILAFTQTLPSADFKSLSVGDLIASMPEDEIEALFQNTFDSRFLVSRSLVKDWIYACVPKGFPTRTVDSLRATLNRNMALGSYCHVVSSAACSSVMIYHQKGVYPLFLITRIMEQQRAYNKGSELKSFSVDAAIEQRIIDEHFSLQPSFDEPVQR